VPNGHANEREAAVPPPDLRKEVSMRLIKRLAVAAGSLLALLLAGGAHFKP